MMLNARGGSELAPKCSQTNANIPWPLHKKPVDVKPFNFTNVSIPYPQQLSLVFPSTLQRPPRTPLKALQDPPRKTQRPPGPPLSPPDPTKNSRMCAKSPPRPSWRRLGPLGPQDRPKRPQDPPTTAPRPTKDPQDFKEKLQKPLNKIRAETKKSVLRQEPKSTNMWYGPTCGFPPLTYYIMGCGCPGVGLEIKDAASHTSHAHCFGTLRGEELL